MVVTGVVPPAALLAELKVFLRIDGADEDALLNWLLRAATEAVESWLGWMLIERELEERRLVREGGLSLSGSPFRQLLSAATDAGEAIDPETVTVAISRFGIGHLAVPDLGDGDGVTVRYRAGLSSDWNGLPEPVRLGVLRAAAHFHAHRDEASDAGLPPAVARLVSPWRARRMI